MTRQRLVAQPQQQKPRAELAEEQLNNVSGGIIAVRPSRPVDEGPEETITFVYGKLGIKYTPQT